MVHLQETLDAAVRHKWKSSTFKSQIQRQKQKQLYYQKLLAAVHAGFTIVPNMAVDVFAIRVKREAPSQRPVENTSTSGYMEPYLENEKEQRLPVGEGRYKSPEQTITTRKSEGVNEKKEKTYTMTWVPDGFADMEFPLAVAHPVVMDATARAMAFKIFDRIGVVQNSEYQTAGRGDPIVLGQIIRKEGYSTKCASFLIAWYLDPKTL